MPAGILTELYCSHVVLILIVAYAFKVQSTLYFCSFVILFLLVVVDISPVNSFERICAGIYCVRNKYLI